MNPLLTLGDLRAQILEEFPGTSLSQIKYAVQSRSIRHRQRAGMLRLWAADDVDRLREALRDIGASAQSTRRSEGVTHVA